MPGKLTNLRCGATLRANFTRGCSVRTCPNCRTAIVESARFCPGCGQAVALVRPERPAACPSCGSLARPGALFCGSCGHAAPSDALPARTPLDLARIVLGVGVVAVIAALVVTAVLVFPGRDSGGEALTFARVGPVDRQLVESINRTFAGVAAPAGATDRDQVRSLMGLPDAFVLSFERSGKNGDGPTIRYETWFYYEILSALEFADGELISNLPIDEVTAPTILPRGYDPSAFKRSMRWDDAKPLVYDAAAFSPRSLPREFDVPITFYAGSQLLLGFDDEGLVYAETIPLSLGAGQ